VYQVLSPAKKPPDCWLPTIPLKYKNNSKDIGNSINTLIFFISNKIFVKLIFYITNIFNDLKINLLKNKTLNEKKSKYIFAKK